MKTILLGLFLLLATELPARAGDLHVSLSPIPYEVSLPEEAARRLTTGPLSGSFASEVTAAGAAAATVVRYHAGNGDEVVLFTAFYVPLADWEADQSPDHPPLFGQEVARAGGMVLGVAGPFDTIFEPGTPDGRNVALLADLISRPERYSPAP